MATPHAATTPVRPLPPGAAGLAAWAGLTLAAGVLALVFPTAAIALVSVALTGLLASRYPAAAVGAALLVAGFEGLLKARLTIEGVPSASAVGAIVVDLALLAAAVGVLWPDRGRSLRAVWAGADRPARFALGLVVAWLVVSLLRVPFSPKLPDAVQGLRLTQAYVGLVLAGIALAAMPARERATVWMLRGFATVAAFATLRAFVDPSLWERSYAEDRSVQSAFGSLVRDFGSFSSVFGLASYLVPVAIFASVVGLLDRGVRRLAWITFVLAAIGIVQSYVRIGIVAIAIGLAAAAAIIVAGPGMSRRAKAIVAVVMVAVIGAVYGAAMVAGDATTKTKSRAEGLRDPLGDQSLQIRWRTWKHFAPRVVDSPLGSGIGTVGRATERDVGASPQDRGTVYTDNSYLKIGVEQGLVGGLLFTLGLVATVALAGRRLARAGPGRPAVAVAAVAAAAAFLAMCVVGEYIELAGKAIFWTLLGVALWHAYGAHGGHEGERDR